MNTTTSPFTQTERIARMEQILDEASAAVQALEDALARCASLQEDVRTLEAYYTSSLWRRDYEDDEAGRIPADLKRGVLSQDAVYDLLCRWKQLWNAHGSKHEED